MIPKCRKTWRPVRPSTATCLGQKVACDPTDQATCCRISTGCRVQIQGSRGGPSGGFPGAMVGNGVQLLTCHPVLIPWGRMSFWEGFKQKSNRKNTLSLIITGHRWSVLFLDLAWPAVKDLCVVYRFNTTATWHNFVSRIVASSESAPKESTLLPVTSSNRFHIKLANQWAKDVKRVEARSSGQMGPERLANAAFALLQRCFFGSGMVSGEVFPFPVSKTIIAGSVAPCSWPKLHAWYLKRRAKSVWE